MNTSETKEIKTKRTAKTVRHSAILNLVYIAMSTAIITVCSQISIPLKIIVPFTLQTFAVFVIAALLGWKRGMISVVVYILLGLIGVPVFAQFSAGISTLLSPTGGYIIGFLFTAFIVGIMTDKLGKKVWVLTVSMVIGLLICYAFGTAWFIMIYNIRGDAMDLATSLSYCVYPFLIADALKIAVATVIVNRLDKVIKL